MWAVGLISGLVLLILLVLLVPVYIVFAIGGGGRVRVKWLFGLVGKELGVGKKQPGPERPLGRRKRGSLRMLLRILSTRGFVQWSWRFLAQFLRTIRVRDLELRLRLGLGDPAETGFLLAAIGPVLASVPPAQSIAMQVEPDFGDGTFQAYCTGAVRVFPVQIVWLLPRFVLSPVTVRLVKAMIKAPRS